MSHFLIWSVNYVVAIKALHWKFIYVQLCSHNRRLVQCWRPTFCSLA